MVKLRYCLRDQPAMSDLIRRILLSWLLAVLIEYIRVPAAFRDLTKLEGLAQMSPLRVIGITCFGVVLLSMIPGGKKIHRLERWGVYLVFAALCITASISSPVWSFLFACILLLLPFTFYVFYGWDSSDEPTGDPQKAHKSHVWITVGLSAVFFLFLAAWTVGRIYCFRAPCYDFGIFSQMFYYMKETGLPLTTVERDGLLSHFAVHVSPIYYLLLPVYWLFPFPATLQVSQAVILTSAVIPLWKIGKHYGLNGIQRVLVCTVLLVYPAYSGGVGYDIHENCFLTPLLLWLFYGIATSNGWLISVAAVLTLTVKEDAAVYVAVIALWLIVRALIRSPRKLWDFYTGAALLGVSVGWFFVSTGYLARSGDGVMSYRYENFMYDGSTSLFTVIKSVILNPMKAIYECADSEKISFLALTILPMLGLPLLTRRYERYILLIPYILVNLMSDYPYQHDIFFQYTFGSVAFLIYLTVVNLADIKNVYLRIYALIAAIAIGTACFSMVVVRRAATYPSLAIRHYTHYQSIRDILDAIPDEASVSATSYYAAYLSQRDILYDIQYSSAQNVFSTEFIVLNPTMLKEYAQYGSHNLENGYENLVTMLEKAGYSQWASLNNDLMIYHRDTFNTN